MQVENALKPKSKKVKSRRRCYLTRGLEALLILIGGTRLADLVLGNDDQHHHQKDTEPTYYIQQTRKLQPSFVMDKFRVTSLTVLGLVIALPTTALAVSVDTPDDAFGAVRLALALPPTPRPTPPPVAPGYTVTLHIAAALVVLVASALGALLPFAARGSRFEGTEATNAIKAFGCGVLLATAMIHMLPPASELLGQVAAFKGFPAAAGMLAMLAMLILHLVEFSAVEAVLQTGVAKPGPDTTVDTPAAAVPGARRRRSGSHSHSHAHGGHSHDHAGTGSSVQTSPERSGAVIHDIEGLHPGSPTRSHRGSFSSEAPADETTPLVSHSQHPLPIPRFRGLDFTGDISTSRRASTMPPPSSATGAGAAVPPLVHVTFKIVQPKNCSHSHMENCNPSICGHTHVGAFDLADLQRRQLSTYVLVMSVALHSFVVGATVGLEPDLALFPILCALVFHQAFEGLALGVKLSESHRMNPHFGETSSIPTVLLSMIFTLAAPMGVILGILLRAVIDHGSDLSKTLEGSLEAVSGGILLYVGLVTFLSGELDVHTGSLKGKVAMLFSLWVGAVVMGLLGFWV